MGKSFSEKMLRFFECEEGAYSVVTSDEHKKSQATFVGPEQTLAERFFGADLKERHGSLGDIKAKGIDPNLEFRIFPVGTRKGLTVSYKTGKANELRIYFRKDVFKPAADDYWLVFVKQNAIWLASLTKSTLEGIESGNIKPKPRISILEEEIDDIEYQEEVNGSAPALRRVQQLKWVRKPSIAKKALGVANFKCELKPDWPTFRVSATGNWFVEAHHLIPLSRQPLFGDVNLDTEENICVLNPTCHRMLHFAGLEFIEQDLLKLIKRRSALLDRLGIKKDDVLTYYEI
jgi:5-methylcytosine-specific restriction enzyme A